MAKAYVPSRPRWHKGFVKDMYLFRCCSTFCSLGYSSSYYLERFGENADIHADLADLHEQPPKVGPGTALKCARRVI